MKTYEMPRKTWICKDNEILRKTPDELCIWEIDQEAGEVVIQCCFEKIQPWEYLAGIGKPVISKYIEELEDKECFRRLDEPRELVRIECDVDENWPTVLDLNHCEPWEFGITAEPRENIFGVEPQEKYNACVREELCPRRIAVRKDNLWWIVALNDLQIWEPAFKKLYPLSKQCGLYYERGKMTDDWMVNDDYYYDDPKQLYFFNRKSLLVGETVDGRQYGLFLDGFDDQWLELQEDDEEPWTVIHHIGGELVMLERESDGEMTVRKVMSRFERVIVEDTAVDRLFDEGFRMWGTHPLMWFEKEDGLTIVNVEDDRFGFGIGFSDCWEFDAEKDPMDWKNELPRNNGMVRYRVMDIWNNNRTLEVEGRGSRRFRVLCGTDCVPGKWDYAEIMRFSEDPEKPFFLVKKDGLWGIIDKDGVIEVPFVFLEKEKAEERGKIYRYDGECEI